MNTSNKFIAAAVMSILVGMPTAHAQFSLASLGGSKLTGASAGSASPADVARNTRNAVHSFVQAEAGLAQAFGGYEGLAQQQQLLRGMQVGDAAAKKDDIETMVTIRKSAGAAIDQKMAENAKLDAAQKEQAAKAMVDYVKGLVSTKKLIGSLQSVVKNPLAMGADAGTLLYVGKEVPGVVSSGGSTTGKLLQYLSANGVDVSEATEAAKELGV